ncbi:MAG: hypothetical protein J7M38_10505 [Armatimonadetes bacterium]|nr:hypothetical protein [Armatimonadota bacterium]
MSRGTVGIMVVALALVTVCAALAQDGVNIVVAGETVARVRDKGDYDSIQARADAVQQAISAAMAGQDPATVEVSLKQVDGVWSVFIGDQRVLSVLAAEAEANGMAPHVLGSIWVEKLKKALPKYKPEVAVTVTDLGNPLESAPTTAPAPTTSAPTTTATTTATTTTTEVLEIPVATTTAQPTVAAAEGAKLLIIDAFNKVRALPEDDYVRERQQRAGELLDDLLRVISGGEHGAPEEPAVAEPDTGVSAISVAPAGTTTTSPSPVEEISLEPTGTSTVTVIDTGPATPPASTTTTTAATTTTTGAAVSGSSTSEAELTEGIPVGDPSYARVPQKRRIGKKFAAAQQPYLQLKASDPAAAAQVNELLKAARREFAAHNFDVAEEYLDGALRMLGVTQW